MVAVRLVACSDSFKPKRERLLLRIERNMIGIEEAAKAGAWEAAALFAARQDPLLAAYSQCEGATEAMLMEFLYSRGLVRTIRDPEYMDWICDELFKRGLQPM
jgi:hypothetical protein